MDFDNGNLPGPPSPFAGTGAGAGAGAGANANLSGSGPNTKSLTNIEVTNENAALNLLVSFLNLAQRRGVFSFDESAKIWECIKMFQK
jgi:hypothetical protein